MIKGIIFDLDGTIVDTKLDFNKIRCDLGFQPGEFILEKIDSLPNGEEKEKYHQILKYHELNSVKEATLIDGVADFIEYLKKKSIKMAILTRNYELATKKILEKFELNFTTIFTRDDGPAKPNPWCALKIAHEWEINPKEIMIIGDFLFDIQTGKNAGMQTALYTPIRVPDYAHLADITFNDFSLLVNKIKEKYKIISDSYKLN